MEKKSKILMLVIIFQGACKVLEQIKVNEPSNIINKIGKCLTQYRYLVDSSNGWDRGSHGLWPTLRTHQKKRSENSVCNLFRKKFNSWFGEDSKGSDKFYSTKLMFTCMMCMAKVSVWKFVWIWLTSS